MHEGGSAQDVTPRAAPLDASARRWWTGSTRIEAALAGHQPGQAEQGADAWRGDADAGADVVNGCDERVELERAASAA